MRPGHLPKDTNRSSVYTRSSTTSNLPEIQVGQLPSKFLPYPTGSKVYYKPYTWAEIEYLNASKVDSVTLYDYILGGIRTENFDKADLTMMDFYYIALLRKLSSLGTAQFSMTYSAFGGTHTKIASSEDLDFDDLNIPALPITAKLNNGSLSFSPITIRKYRQLVSLNLADDDISLMAAQCTLPLEESLEIAKTWYGSDLSTLDKVDRLLHHDIKPIKDRISISRPYPIFDNTKPESDINVRYTMEYKEVEINVNDTKTLILPFREQSPYRR